MSLFTIHVDNIHIHYNPEDIADIKQLLITNNQNQKKIMKELDDLKAKVAEQTTQIGTLQESVDKEQAAIETLLQTNASVVAAQQEKISELEAIIADSPQAAEIQTLLDEVTANNDKLATTRADIESTVAGEENEPLEGRRKKKKE